MKKKTIVISSLVIAMLLALFAMRPAQADINKHMWLEPAFYGFDSFYSAPITAYAEGAAAKLAVTVDRDGAPVITQVNITAISVVFDWGGNYTSVPSTAFTLDDTIPQAAFTVTFTVPSTTVASNFFLHTYRIYVKYNTTSGAGTFPIVSGDSIAVYSTTQAEAQMLKQTANSYSLPAGGFSSADATILWEKANAEVSNGDTYYMLGAFAGAKTSYEGAITFYEQAYTAETTYSQDYRTSQTNYNNALANATSKEADAAMMEAEARSVEANATKTEADAAMTQAEAALKATDAALTNAYGWLSFGIGWILIGIGVIVYGLRRPKPPA